MLVGTERFKIGVTVILVLIVASLLVFPNTKQVRGAEHTGYPTISLGVNFNFPFLGVSVRYWNSDLVGVEFNLAPIPAYEKSASLTIKTSSRILYRLTDYNAANFYINGGPAFTFVLEPGKTPILEKSFLAVLGEIQLNDWPVEHLVPVIDYGYTINLESYYDFRWLSGGVGFHYKLK